MIMKIHKMLLVNKGTTNNNNNSRHIDIPQVRFGDGTMYTDFITTSWRQEVVFERPSAHMQLFQIQRRKYSTSQKNMYSLPATCKYNPLILASEKAVSLLVLLLCTTQYFNYVFLLPKQNQKRLFKSRLYIIRIFVCSTK